MFRLCLKYLQCSLSLTISLPCGFIFELDAVACFVFLIRAASWPCPNHITWLLSMRSSTSSTLSPSWMSEVLILCLRLSPPTLQRKPIPATCIHDPILSVTTHSSWLGEGWNVAWSIKWEIHLLAHLCSMTEWCSVSTTAASGPSHKATKHGTLLYWEWDWLPTMWTKLLLWQHRDWMTRSRKQWTSYSWNTYHRIPQVTIS